MDINKEFELLSEYMNIYIQLLPECISCKGLRIHRPQLPTFEEFKNTYNDERYSLVIPHFKESIICINNEVIPIYEHGLGGFNGTHSRYYNIWIGGCKYFTGNNIKGNFIINNK